MRRVAKFQGVIAVLSVIGLAVAVALFPLPAVAQNVAGAPELAPPATGPLSQPPAAPVPAAVSGDVTMRDFFVNLQVDGNLVGRVSLFDAAGNLTPASVSIHFIQNGAVVLMARSDERGNFQAVGLPPGTYSVIAMDQEGFTAFSVRVLPFDQNAAPNQMVLAMTLIPPVDTALLAQMIGQGPMVMAAPAGFPMGAANGGGGGGGAGGGLGAALGAAGLAGLAGLAGQDDEEQMASPFQVPENKTHYGN